MGMQKRRKARISVPTLDQPPVSPDELAADPLAYADAELEPELTDEGLNDPVFDTAKNGVLALGNGCFMRVQPSGYDAEYTY